MRVSMLVVAMIATPLFASVSNAQGQSNVHPNNRYKVCEKLSKRNANADKANANSEHREPMKCTTVPGGPPPVAGTASVNGAVFTDVNGNGYFDSGDLALAGRVVSLSGPVNTTATTLADGSYSFTSLPLGTYTVCAGAGMTQSQPTAGPTCPSGAFGYSLDVTAAAPDAYYLNIDFALQ